MAESRARAQALERDQKELDRVQARLDVLYDDRLDGRIDATKYDEKAAEISQQKDRIVQKIRATKAAVLPPTSEAVDLMTLTSKAADLFFRAAAFGTPQIFEPSSRRRVLERRRVADVLP